MKKIYSFFESAKAMTIIAVASVMLTSVFGFTSCQKDEMPSTITKNQTTVQTQKPATNTSKDEKISGILGVNIDHEDTDLDKKLDTSYAVGEWTATVGGKEYTLVVTNTSSKEQYYTDFKATITVGDQVYDGKLSVTNFRYSGGFESEAKADNGHSPKSWLQCIKLDASNLNEFTAEYVYEDGKTVGENVKFTKK